MARETKEERTVKSMLEPLTEHLLDLKSLAANPNSKESDLERWCQSLIRSGLGYSAVNGYTIRAQETKGRSRPDLIILKGDSPICVVEVKKLGFDLKRSDLRSGKLQLAEYLHSMSSVRWGILTNGYEWNLFDFSAQTTTGIELKCYDIRNEQDDIDTSKKHVESVAWDLIDFHEMTFASSVWEDFSREASAFSPESLAKAVLSLDSIKLISKIIQGEHDYKANVEVLLDRMAKIVEEGLDDAVSGWNEAKQAELNKFVTSQKRANRRSSTRGRRKQKRTVEAIETDQAAASTVETDNTPTATASECDEQKSAA
jgi:hypothetical protein